LFIRSPNKIASLSLQLCQLQNELLLESSKGEISVKETPVWLMRQAERILPEYRAVETV